MWICLFLKIYFVYHLMLIQSVCLASTLGLPLLSVVRPREDTNRTVSRDLFFGENIMQYISIAILAWTDHRKQKEA